MAGHTGLPVNVVLIFVTVWILSAVIIYSPYQYQQAATWIAPVYNKSYEEAVGPRLTALRKVKDVSWVPKNLHSAYLQYKRGVKEPPMEKLLKTDITKWLIDKRPKGNPRHKITSLTFETDMWKGSDGDIQLLIRVGKKNNGTIDIRGCDFAVKQYYQPRGRSGGGGRNGIEQEQGRVEACSVEDMFNGSYKSICRDVRSVECRAITVVLKFCSYEAYSYMPKYSPYNHVVFNRTICTQKPKRAQNEPRGDSERNNGRRETNAGGYEGDMGRISWTLKKAGKGGGGGSRCDRLVLNASSGVPVSLYSQQETCQCVAGFDSVYIISTSHMRVFGDYLMHTCYGKDLSSVPPVHKILEHETIHYYNWGHMQDLYINVKGNLTKWLSSNNKKLAIWIQLGSWDFTRLGLAYSMTVGLDYFNKTITFIKSEIAESRSVVDLRVISTTPMPDAYHYNNFAIAAFSAKMQRISQAVGVSYFDAYSILEACAQSIAQVAGNNNHYFWRVKNKFSGSVGENFYFGVFLPTVCQKKSKSSIQFNQ